MLSKRIIPCLDVKDGRTVKGVHFVGLRDVGDAVELGSRYAAAFLYYPNAGYPRSSCRMPRDHSLHPL